MPPSPSPSINLNPSRATPVRCLWASVLVLIALAAGPALAEPASQADPPEPLSPEARIRSLEIFSSYPQ